MPLLPSSTRTTRRPRSMPARSARLVVVLDELVAADLGLRRLVQRPEHETADGIALQQGVEEGDDLIDDHTKGRWIAGRK